MNFKFKSFLVIVSVSSMMMGSIGNLASAEVRDESSGVFSTLYDSHVETFENYKYSFNSGTYISSKEQFELFKKNFNPDDDKLHEYVLMMEEHEALINSKSNVNSEMRASVRRLGVPFYSQQNGYYCGPATIRQMCGYLNGTANLPSQDDIADELNTSENYGTDQQELIDYLNLHTSECYETLWRNGAYVSSSQLFNLIIADANNNKPTLLHIRDTNTSNWRYYTDGHYLCAEGYVDDTTTNGHNVYLVDPWLAGHNISSGKYDVTVNRLYNVTDRIGS